MQRLLFGLAMAAGGCGGDDDESEGERFCKRFRRCDNVGWTTTYVECVQQVDATFAETPLACVECQLEMTCDEFAASLDRGLCPFCRDECCTAGF